MECQKVKNMEHCNCSYPGCSYHGVCCDCMSRHLKKRQLPACFFTSEAEATYDRSFEHFSQLVSDQS